MSEVKKLDVKFVEDRCYISAGPNRLFYIGEIYMFISEDEKGNEGVCAFRSPEGWVPMIACDEDRFNQLLGKAKVMAKDGSPQKIKLVKFSQRTELGEVGP